MFLVCDKNEKKLLSWLRKATSPDKTRPVLNSLHVKNGTSEACDGIRVHSAPTPERWQEHTGKMILFASKTTQDVNEVQYEENGTYPDINQVKPMGDFTFRVGVNPKILIDALSGFDGMVSLTFYSDTKPFYVKDTDADNPDQWALIMPVYLDENGHT